MTGAEFEVALCKMLRNRGFWALNIPKNKFGAQPFDVIAMRGAEVWAVDCKVCSVPRLPLSRIEDNQWLSFGVMKARTRAICGFVCSYKSELYFIPVEVAENAQKSGAASISLTEDFKWRI